MFVLLPIEKHLLKSQATLYLKNSLIKSSYNGEVQNDIVW